MGVKKQILIYTDGACSQNGTWKGGWGVVIVVGDENKILHTFDGSAIDTTNNAMELTAFKRALEFCHIHSNEDYEFIIYSDSAYILNCFDQKWYVNWRKNGWRNAKKEPVANKELWESILWTYEELLSDNVDITLVKVKGHSGNKYNELADKLAVEASK
jgi:ribonuclease HI